MKNLTITLEEATLRWARVSAAEQGISVSRLVGEMLADKMERNRAYEKAMRQFLSLRPVKPRNPGAPLLTREEAHDRANLR
ncbi:MAG TPA: CopG family transcriptional regulator [Casimicrobiaceae bacterium]